MSKSWWKSNKKPENEKIVASKSLTTGGGQIVHSSSTTSITQQQIITQSETRTTIIQQVDKSSPFVSQSSLNSFTEKISNASGSNTSLQINEKKEFPFNIEPLALKPVYKSSVSTDAVPFTSAGLYKSQPPRSAFLSTPLTGASASSTNLNYQSPYAANRYSPISSNALTTRYAPNNVGNVPSQNNSEELKQKVIIKVIKSTKFHDDPLLKVPHYTTRSKHRGKLLLINNVKFAQEKDIRKGAELDETNTVQLFQQMGFEIIKYKNLGKRDMESKIISFRNDKQLKKVDIGTVVIMSHGTGKESSGSTEVVCTDGELLHTTWIINQFDAALCPQLRGKPKIFIFQCCRGDNKDIQYDSPPTVPVPVARTLSDMLIAYSTVPGFVSHRDPQNGTWYIQAICKVFMEHAHDTDVENLLKIVDSMLSGLVSSMGSKQTSSFENRGFKTCYLHPQLFQ